MSQIGTLVTGAGVTTVITGQAQCDQYILIGDVDTAVPLTGIQVEIDGTPFISITGSQPLVQAFAQWLMETTGSAPGYMFKIATGSIGRNTTFRFTNVGATTPNIYAFSEAGEGIPFIATTVNVNASSYQVFEKFSALMFATPANIQSLEITFNNNGKISKSTLTAVEAGALFALYNQSAADGYLSAVLVIDNTKQNVQSVRVNTGAGSCVVLVVKLPDDSFALLNQ